MNAEFDAVVKCSPTVSQYVPEKQPTARNHTHPQHSGDIAVSARRMRHRSTAHTERAEQKSQEQERQRGDLFECGFRSRKRCPHTTVVRSSAS